MCSYFYFEGCLGVFELSLHFLYNVMRTKILTVHIRRPESDIYCALFENVSNRPMLEIEIWLLLTVRFLLVLVVLLLLIVPSHGFQVYANVKSGDQLHWLEVYHDFPQSLQQNPEIFLILPWLRQLDVRLLYRRPKIYLRLVQVGFMVHKVSLE